MQDLVPCVLISFERENILMWRGREWKSSFLNPKNDITEVKESDVDDSPSISPPSEGQEASTSCAFTASVKDVIPEMNNTSTSSIGSEVVGTEGREDLSPSPYIEPCAAVDIVSTVEGTYETVTISDVIGFRNDEAESERSAYRSSTIPHNTSYADDEPETIFSTSGTETILDDRCHSDEASPTTTVGAGTMPVTVESAETKLDPLMVASGSNENPQDASVDSQNLIEQARLSAACKEKVLSLLNDAVGSGSALILDESSLDADIIYQGTVDLAKSAPPGPVFRHRPRRVTVQKSKRPVEKQEGTDSEVKEITIYAKQGSEKKDSKVQRTRTRDFGEPLDSVVPQGSLRVDELAKLLA